jgi:transposase
VPRGKGRPELKRSRYLWLRNEPSLSAESRALFAALTRLHLKTARAIAFQEVYNQPNWDWGALFLDSWYSWAIRSRLEPMKEAARDYRSLRNLTAITHLIAGKIDIRLPTEIAVS